MVNEKSPKCKSQLRFAKFPHKLKTSVMASIPKIHQPKTIEFRPINLLLAIDKVIEAKYESN